MGFPLRNFTNCGMGSTMKNTLSTIALLAAITTAIPATAAKPKAIKGEASIPLPLVLTIPERQRICTMKTASGLGFKVLRAGAGATPSSRATTTINYIGYLAIDGSVFDQNVNAQLPVDGVIPGFAEGLQMIPAGAIYRLCIPAKLGYGERGAGPIKPNSDLIFQVEMLDIGR
jgi:FKBP-type peptidyl-prolyl cis-trans isomerase FkpA